MWYGVLNREVKSNQVLENGGGCGGSVMMKMEYNVMKRHDVEKMTAGTTVCIESWRVYAGVYRTYQWGQQS